MTPHTISIVDQYHENDKLQLVRWDTTQFDFRGLITQHLFDCTGCPASERLHEFIPRDKMPTHAKSGTEHTYGHDLLYAIDPAFRQAGYIEAKDVGFIRTYRDFIQHLQENVFQEELVFQRLPSLRIQYSGFYTGTADKIMHRDRDFDHPAEEINIWVPIATCHGTASMWIESKYDLGDYAPVNIDYGSLLIFDSGLVHGSVLNTEGATRISLDMRVIPKRIYTDSSSTFSATAGREFKLGDYYDLIRNGG